MANQKVSKKVQRAMARRGNNNITPKKRHGKKIPAWVKAQKAAREMVQKQHAAVETAFKNRLQKVEEKAAETKASGKALELILEANQAPDWRDRWGALKEAEVLLGIFQPKKPRRKIDRTVLVKFEAAKNAQLREWQQKIAEAQKTKAIKLKRAEEIIKKAIEKERKENNEENLPQWALNLEKEWFMSLPLTEAEKKIRKLRRNLRKKKPQQQYVEEKHLHRCNSCGAWTTEVHPATNICAICLAQQL